MKQTIHVNIASQAFTLDEDAYYTLDRYFKEVKQHLPVEDTETMDDIEARVAEIFRETATSPMLVITLNTVRKTMAQMGSPSDYGAPRSSDSETGRYPHDTCYTSSQRKLRRPRQARCIAGVCAGIAAYMDVDPTLVRALAVVLTFVGGLSIWIYIILWIVIPEKTLAGRQPSSLKQ